LSRRFLRYQLSRLLHRRQRLHPNLRRLHHRRHRLGRMRPRSEI